MRLICLPSSWNAQEGLIPVELQDIDIHATKAELRALITFLASVAEQAKISIDFGDSKPDAQTGIWINVQISDIAS